MEKNLTLANKLTSVSSSIKSDIQSPDYERTGIDKGWWDRSNATKFEADHAQSVRLTVETVFDLIEWKIYSPSMACGRHPN